MKYYYKHNPATLLKKRHFVSANRGYVREVIGENMQRRKDQQIHALVNAIDRYIDIHEDFGETKHTIKRFSQSVVEEVKELERLEAQGWSRVWLEITYLIKKDYANQRLTK